MNRNSLLIGLLVLALVVVLLLWMNDRASQDAELNIDVGWTDAPALVRLA